MSRQVNSESILPDDINPSLTNSTDISNNNNIINSNNIITSNSNNDNNNDSSKSNSNQNTSNFSNNDNDRRKMPEVVVNGPTTKNDDYDIDDEVMGFMHAYIQSHLKARRAQKSAAKKPSRWQIARKRLMDNETKAYFDEVIRGSALFGLIPDDADRKHSDGDAEMKSPTQERPQDQESSSSQNDEVDNMSSSKGESSKAKGSWQGFSRVLLAQKVAEAFVANKPDSSPTDGPSSSSYNPMNDNMPSWDAPLKSARDNALAPDDYNEALNGRISRHSECSIEADLLTERENMLEEEDASELAKRLESELTGTILALWQERLTQKSTTEADIEIEYASESDMGSTGPPSPTGLGFSPTTIPPPVQFADNTTKVNNRLNPIRNSNPVHPMAPVKLPMPPSDGLGNNNNALEEIRSRLRKTKFDYSSDSRQRISDATPQLDYRAVLKKKGKV